MKRSTAAWLLATALSVSDTARAQSTSQPRPEAPADTAAAEQLFYEGRNLMAQHRYPEACMAFERAEKVHATIGVLLNLADCYAQAGRTASAWAKFHEAVLAAQQASDSREAYARQRVATLEPSLLKLTIDASTLRSERGAELRIDGTPLDPSQWATPTPVDAGRHVVDVQAPGRRAWSAAFDVAASIAVIVPPLQEVRGETIESQNSSSAEPPVSSSTHAIFWNARNITSGSLLAAGAVSVAVGVYVGLQSQNEKSTADALGKTLANSSACWHPSAADQPSCDALRSVRNAQKRDGNLQEPLFVASGALAVGAIATWILWPKSDEAHASTVGLAPMIGPSSGSISLQGAF